MRSRLCLAMFAAVALALCASRAAMGGGSIHDAARRVPADVDLLVILDRACVARATPCGRAAGEIAREFVRSETLDGAWSELGRALGRTNEQTFDELLGRRVTLGVRGLRDAKPAWAIRAVVSLDTERRLRERLRVAPRTIVGGRSVLAVEHGGLELATDRRDGWATILLGPAASPALFDELAQTLGGAPAAPMSADPRFASLAPLGDGELLVFARGGADMGGWFGCVAQTDGDALRIGLRAGADTMTGCDPGVPTTSRAQFDRLAHGALLAALERPIAPRGRDSALVALLSQLPALALGPDQSVLIGDRLALLALPGDGAPSFAAALEVRSASSAAPVIDRLLARTLSLAGVDGQCFDGLEPGAVRVAHVDAAAFSGACEPLFAGRQVEWSHPSGARPHPGAGAMTATLDSVPDDAGWCVAALGDEAGERLRAVLTRAGEACAASRAPEDDGGEQPTLAKWVSLGRARPADLLGALRGAGMALPACLAAFDAIESAEWSVRLDTDNALTGRALIRVVERPALAASEADPVAPAKPAPVSATRR